MSESRRLQTRHDVAVTATLEVAGQVLEGEFRNLSLGGAFFAVTLEGATFTTGSRGTVSFQIPTQDNPVSVGASLRWISDAGIGLQFDGLRAGEVWSLNKYFEQLAS